MSAAAILRQLCINGFTNRNELSESTVYRFLNNLALKEKTTNNQDMRRYERAHVNEVWCGDSSIDPYLKIRDLLIEEKKNNQMQAIDCDAVIQTAQFRFSLIARFCRGLFLMEVIPLTSCVSQKNLLLYLMADV